MPENKQRPSDPNQRSIDLARNFLLGLSSTIVTGIALFQSAIYVIQKQNLHPLLMLAAVSGLGSLVLVYKNLDQNKK